MLCSSESRFPGLVPNPERARVVYEPVSIEPRVLVPRVKREDHRYMMDGDVADKTGEGQD